MSRHYYGGARDTTRGARRIELAWLRKHNFLTGYSEGVLTWSQNGEPNGKINVMINLQEDPKIEFDYKIRPHGESEWTDMKYSFPMVKISCHYGGFKWFFICGLYKRQQYCGRRVRILYDVGNYFGCRHCADLSYDVCNVNKRHRSGMWKALFGPDADEYYATLKRRSYRGKPTRKYRKYLKMAGVDMSRVDEFINTELSN